MSDVVFPGEETGNYEPLQFEDFHKQATHSFGMPSSYIGKKSATLPDVVLPTAAEIEDMQNQAREEAYQAAYGEGSQRMAALAESFQQALKQAEQDVAQDVLDLAVEIARQMIKQTLSTHPEILLGIVREAVNALPHVGHAPHIHLHPEDAAVLRGTIGAQLEHTGWKLMEDPAISRGGVRVETAQGQVDATIENRWKRVVAAIGIDRDWVAE